MNIQLALYALYTPEERVRLALAASEREDLTEIDRLFRSCPGVEHILPDPRFTAPLMTMQAEVSRLLMLWVEFSAVIILQALIPNRGRANAAWRNMSAMWLGIEAGIDEFCVEAKLTRYELLALGGGRPEFVTMVGRGVRGNAPVNRQVKEAIRRRLS